MGFSAHTIVASRQVRNIIRRSDSQSTVSEAMISTRLWLLPTCQQLSLSHLLACHLSFVRNAIFKALVWPRCIADAIYLGIRTGSSPSWHWRNSLRSRATFDFSQCELLIWILMDGQWNGPVALHGRCMVRGSMYFHKWVISLPLVIIIALILSMVHSLDHHCITSRESIWCT